MEIELCECVFYRIKDTNHDKGWVALKKYLLEIKLKNSYSRWNNRKRRTRSAAWRHRRRRRQRNYASQKYIFSKSFIKYINSNKQRISTIWLYHQLAKPISRIPMICSISSWLFAPTRVFTPAVDLSSASRSATITLMSRQRYFSYIV